MVIQPEQLIESLMDLERSRMRERDSRLESEALLEGLRRITDATGYLELFQELVKVLEKVLNFEHAFILQVEPDESLTLLATTYSPVENTKWKIGKVFRKALNGKPIASYDVSLVPEWQKQPPIVLDEITSALHVGMHGGDWKALLVVTHKQARHFGPKDIRKAIRFSPLATQAFLTLELQRAVIQRDRFFQLSMDIMAILNVDGTFHQYNAGWTEVLGYGREELLGRNLFSLVAERDRPILTDVIETLKISTVEKQLVELQFVGKNSTEYWLSCSIASYPDEDLLYFVARDITDRVVSEKRLSHQASHDALTGLKNRSEFMYILREAYRKYHGSREDAFAVLFLDLNKFKEINDTLGHEAGDELLIHFARTLEKATRSRDTVARLGGDEFTILVNNIEAKQAIDSIVERIQQGCAVPFFIGAERVQISASIGVAISTEDCESEEDVLKKADLAMYEAKKAGGVSYVLAR